MYEFLTLYPNYIAFYEGRGRGSKTGVVCKVIILKTNVAAEKNK